MVGHDLTDMIDKNEMRREMRVRRNDFVYGLRQQEMNIAFSRVPGPLDAYFIAGNIVAGYVATGSEADPSRLIEQAHAKGCVIALPHVTSKTSPIRFLKWAPGDALEDGPFGLKQPFTDAEPCVPNVTLVPLVAFDESLMRLGQGAGHYDRALSLLDNAFNVGIAWSMQQVLQISADPWDIPLDAILTEKYWMAA